MKSFLVGLVGVIFIILLINKASNSNINSNFTKEQMIFEVAKGFVTKQLKCPSTAQFPIYDNSFVTLCRNGRYRVLFYVDAQNEYGAMLRKKCMSLIEIKDGKCLDIETNIIGGGISYE